MTDRTCDDNARWHVSDVRQAFLLGAMVASDEFRATVDVDATFQNEIWRDAAAQVVAADREQVDKLSRVIAWRLGVQWASGRVLDAVMAFCERRKRRARLRHISVILETQHRDQTTVDALVAERADLQAKEVA